MPRMHHALRDALVVEVEVEVLEEGRTAGADLERVLIVRDGGALIGGQHPGCRRARSDGVATPASGELLIAELHGGIVTTSCHGLAP